MKTEFGKKLERRLNSFIEVYNEDLKYFAKEIARQTVSSDDDGDIYLEHLLCKAEEREKDINYANKQLSIIMRLEDLLDEQT